MMDQPARPPLARYRALLADVFAVQSGCVVEDERIPAMVEGALAALVEEAAHQSPDRRRRVSMTDCVRALRWRFGLADAGRPMMSYREIGIEMGLGPGQAQGRVFKGERALYGVLKRDPTWLTIVIDPRCQVDLARQHEANPLAALIRQILALPDDARPEAIAACQRLVEESFESGSPAR